MTTLLDSKQYTLADLGALYHARWQVEESYKVKKCRLQIEHISGATPEIALQDFHARVLKECPTSAMLLDVDRHISQTMTARKFNYKVCITQALAKMKNSLPLIFLRSNPASLIRKLLDVFAKSLVSLEPDRKFRRKRGGKCSSKTVTYTFGYRPNR